MRAFYRAIRIFAAVTLFFFCWTYLPLYAAVAYAATPQSKGTIKRSPAASTNGQERPEARFEKALEDIRQTTIKAGEKTDKGEDASAEIRAIKAKRAEIESLDTDLKKEFAATEKKLKDAHLPKEILDRHYKFVKHYEDNLKELRANLDDVELAKTTSDRKAKIEKIRLHLEKVKPSKMHKLLDPNNLPNRLVKGKKRAPRLKKEDFEKDFPPQRSPRTASNPQDFLSADLRRFTQSSGSMASALQSKPVLLAFNEVASDIPFTLPRPLRERIEVRGSSDIQQLAFAASAPFLVAQASGQPSSDDLAETPDIQFTDAIRAKAQELGNNPVKIYEYVRNNIEYAPTFGSIQGADQCLQSKICNDIDTASLLISLLRVSGIYSHYVYGTVDIPIEKAMNWVGGVTNPQMVGTIFATNGVPVTLLKTSGSVYKYARIEHIWVSAFIDYIPSRGAVQRQGNTWIPLDPSYKQYTYTQGIDVASAVPFDAQSFSNQILSTATTNTTDGSVTNVNSAYVQQTMQDYQTQVQNYIQQNYPSATVGDVIGKKEIKTQVLGILPPTLPYIITQTGSEFAQVSDNLRETMSFTIPDTNGTSAGLTYSTGMPQIAGKKITLSFSPATADDQTVIESLLPQPHADGTPIQPSELPSSFPAYLLNLKPELRIDGQVVATGASGMMGSEQSFTMSLNEPGIGMSNIDNIVKAGEYFGIGVDTARIGADRINALKTKLENTKAKLDAQTYSGLTKEDLVGDILFTAIETYFAALNATDEISARAMSVIRYRAPSIGMFSLALNIKDAFGVPISAGPKGIMIDVDRIMQAVFSKDGSMDRVKQYMLSSGSNSSALEHAIPEQLFSTPVNQVQGISAVKALKAANDQGIPIYTIDQTNVNTILPLLQLSADVKTDIQNVVNAGKIVTAPRTKVTINGWTGCGYVITDPNTGAGAYMINGGLNGGGFMYMFWTVMWVLAWVVFITACTVFVITLGAVIATYAGTIAAALGAVANTVGGWALTLGELYLDTSISLSSYPGITALYATFMSWAAMSPPPMPFPTDPLEGAIFLLMYFRFFLFYELLNTVENISPTMFWKFAMHTVDLRCAIC